jgi:uncharacterized cupredoxin-like copper-binding protein
MKGSVVVLKKSVPLVLTVILSIGILSACTSKTTTTSLESTTIKIDMNEFSFSQKEIKVKQGEKIHFVLTNTGKYAHDVNSEELKIDKDVDPGNTEELDWTAPQKAGSYQIICDKPGHMDKGMKIAMTIE